MYEIAFPKLGIYIEHLPNSINIGGFSIAFYGMIIGLGIIIGLLLTWKEARRTGQREDDYTEYIIWGILGGVVGARLYYVLFRWDYYGSHLAEIINLRSGGLAIYGTIIGSFTALIIYCAVKKRSFFLMIDTMAPYLVLAQGLGRWGNFFNMEAFGRSYDGLLSMQIKLDCVNSLMLDEEVLANTVMVNGIEYIQVVPTFLIESLWCFLIFAVLIIYRPHKRFNGEILCIYGFMYGLERMIVEGLRTDSLMIGNTGIRVSQALSAVIVVASVAGYFMLRHLAKTHDSLKPPIAVTEGAHAAAGSDGSVQKDNIADGTSAEGECQNATADDDGQSAATKNDCHNTTTENDNQNAVSENNGQNLASDDDGQNAASDEEKNKNSEEIK